MHILIKEEHNRVCLPVVPPLKVRVTAERFFCSAWRGGTGARDERAVLYFPSFAQQLEDGARILVWSICLLGALCLMTSSEATICLELFFMFVKGEWNALSSVTAVALTSAGASYKGARFYLHLNHFKVKEDEAFLFVIDLQ